MAYGNEFAPSSIAKGGLPGGYIARWMLQNVAVFHTLFVLLVAYLVFFLFLVGVLLVIQTGNFLLGRTTYERFSGLTNPAYEDAPAEMLNPSTDVVTIQNCRFMCCNCSIPGQKMLEDSQVRTRLKSSASMLSVASISGIHTGSYHTAVGPDQSLEELKEE